MIPKEASRKENENKVWRNLYPEFGSKTLAPKFSIGDNVRITKKKICLIRLHSKVNGRGFQNFKNSIDHSSYIKNY